MKILSKNKIIVFILMIILLFIINIIININKSKNNDEHNYKGVYIYNDWKNNISVSKGDNVLIQIPIYDFNNEIDINNVVIDIDNLNIGKVEDIDISSGEKYDNFTSYMISFYMIFDEIGKYNLDDIIINISTEENTYSKSIGEFNISVYDKKHDNDDIEIIGGTGLVSTEESIGESNKNSYIMNYKLRNKSNNDIKIDNISLNKSEDMNIEFKDVIIKANEEKEIEFKYIVNKSVKSSIIEPNIYYEVLDKNYIMSGSQIILAEPLPVDRVNELVKE